MFVPHVRGTTALQRWQNRRLTIDARCKYLYAHVCYLICIYTCISILKNASQHFWAWACWDRRADDNFPWMKKKGPWSRMKGKFSDATRGERMIQWHQNNDGDWVRYKESHDSYAPMTAVKGNEHAKRNQTKFPNRDTKYSEKRDCAWPDAIFCWWTCKPTQEASPHIGLSIPTAQNKQRFMQTIYFLNTRWSLISWCCDIGWAS